MASRASTRMLGRVNARSLWIIAPSHNVAASSRPRVGTARTELASETSQRARPVWPTHSPNGIAMTAARSTAIAVYSRCCRVRLGMPSSPCQLAGSVNHAQMELIMPAPPAPGARA